MEIVVAAQNVGRGGLRAGDGTAQDRWPALAEALASMRPDILLIQEAEGWDANGAAQLVRAETDLGMDGSLTPSSSGLGPALLYRRETLGRRRYENSDFGATETHHGFQTIGWDIPALPALLCAGSVHLTPYDADKARAEANFIASRSHRAGGGYAILGGDLNFAPQDGPEPDLTMMRPYNRGSRLLPSNGGDELPRADRSVAQKLADNGFVDVARHLSLTRGGDQALLAPTAAGMRLDQIWVSGALAPCITDYGLLDHGASDHCGLWARLDLSLAKTDDVWEYV